MKLQDLVLENKHFFWSTRNYKSLSDEVIVETFLNYADMDEIKKMIGILGMKKTKRIFQKQSRQKRCNYEPIIKNYFQLFFKKYAS